jgi:hypothetical protein
LENAPSVGRFYLAEVKGRFDCRVQHPPSYPAVVYTPPIRPQCSVDCSSEDDGYQWAEDQGIGDADDCNGGTTRAFEKGCLAYLKNLDEAAQIEIMNSRDPPGAD